LVLAVAMNILQALMGPPGPEYVKQKTTAECRGLARAMIALKKDYGPEESLALACLASRLRGE
jgi:hypothetical protein